MPDDMKQAIAEERAWMAGLGFGYKLGVDENWERLYRILEASRKEIADAKQQV